MIYARADLAYVNVPAENGGCGQPHHRPVEQGAPVKLWTLECTGCEDVLRHHDLWATSITEIPETFDEGKAREDFEKRGALDERRLMALALARMTGLDLPETMLAAIGGAKVAVPTAQGTMLCPQGHANLPGQNFCGTCGQALHGPAPDRALEAPAPANGNSHTQEGWEPPRDGQGRKKPMRDWRLEDLQTLAGQLGVDPGGNRPELIDRLRAAKKETAAA